MSKSPNCSSGNLVSPNRRQGEADLVDVAAEEKESRSSLVKEFATLLFESRQSEDKVISIVSVGGSFLLVPEAEVSLQALMLASFLSARRFVENDPCSDHMNLEAMRLLNQPNTKRREECTSAVFKSAKVPPGFVYTTNSKSQEIYEDVLGSTTMSQALNQLSQNLEGIKLSKICGPLTVDNISEVGSVSHHQAAHPEPNGTSINNRPLRKRRHLQHDSLRKEDGIVQVVNRKSVMHQKNQPANDKMDVEDEIKPDGKCNSPENADPLRALGFKTAGDQFRAARSKFGGAVKANAGSSPTTNASRAGTRGPRIGLSKRTTDADNLRGGFVPPFVKKAMDAHGDKDQQTSFSAKTLELLGGQDGELPEELQKLDPHLVETICSEIIDKGGTVDWDDIAGQEPAKQLVQELVVWPMLNPHLFKGARTPAKGLLLFGPPGTGKTLIGRAIASNINATFFSISASSLTSKWIGEGEKLVRTLFAVSAWVQPAVIFIDEIDSILSSRKADGEHEASRRLKTELLVQMDGCNTKSATSIRILVIGATNRPEELDEAARRRMPKQLYIPLPGPEAREQMICRHLSGITSSLSPEEIKKIVSRTLGYSGSDMKNLVQEACQGPVRDAVQAAQKGLDLVREAGSRISQLSDADLRPVVLRDFQVAARAQKPSVGPAEVTRHEDYDGKYGAKYSTPDDNMIEEDW